MPPIRRSTTKSAMSSDPTVTAPAKGTDYGDGQILFFTGSPARLEIAVAVHGDRISGMGDMPVSMLRELIRSSTQ